YAARAAVLGRKHGPANRQGRIGAGVANLFGGLLRHARDNSTIYVACRCDGGVRSRVLINASSVERSVRAYTFSYTTFEWAILSCLREINPKEIVGTETPITDVSVLQGELNELRDRKALLALDLLQSYSPMLAEAARQLEAREAELLEQIDENQETVAAPREDAWETMHSLVDLLAATPPGELEDLRLRLRASIRRLISMIFVLVVPRGRSRLVAVQVYFSEGKKRDYLIYRRPTLCNTVHGKTRVTLPEETWVRSFAGGDLDLRRHEHAAKVESLLLGLDLTADVVE